MIDREAFYKSGIEKVILNEGLEEIGNYAFSECFNLTEITIPKRVTHIATGAFEQSGLELVNMLANVKELPEWIFGGCGMLKEISLPDSIERIEDYAFAWDYDADISIPKSCKHIGVNSFNFGTKERVEIPAHIESLETLNFENRDEEKDILREVVFKGNLNTIPAGCFESIESLERVDLSKGCKRIETLAFSGCKNLKELILPDHAIEIEERAFLDCCKLDVSGIMLRNKPYKDTGEELRRLDTFKREY